MMLHTPGSFRMTISTHVLDTKQGRPAVGVPFVLTDAKQEKVAEGVTNEDGRTISLADVHLTQGVYHMIFDTAAYFESQHVSEFFYPRVDVAFYVANPSSHYHVPLILSPFGYSTYRGS